MHSRTAGWQNKILFFLLNSSLFFFFFKYTVTVPGWSLQLDCWFWFLLLCRLVFLSRESHPKTHCSMVSVVKLNVLAHSRDCLPHSSALGCCGSLPCSPAKMTSHVFPSAPFLLSFLLSKWWPQSRLWTPRAYDSWKAAQPFLQTLTLCGGCAYSSTELLIPQKRFLRAVLTNH